MDGALQLFSSLGDKEISPDVVTYNSIIDGLCNMRRMDEAKDILKKMIANDVCPNVWTCSILWMLGAEMEMWKRLSILMLVNFGIKSNIISYKFLDEWECEDDLKLCKEMEALQVSAHIMTSSILLDGLYRAHCIAEAFFMLHTMEDKDIIPNIVTYNILIEGLCNDNKVKEAKDLFNELLSKGLLKRNKMHDALPMLEEMDSRGFTLDKIAYSMLIEHVQREGRDIVLFDKVKKLVPKDFNSS
ncbi:putative pentatricopeptide repeat-containing protein At1g12700, mitochondrial [Salvia miltiorrhiza]|uniref:putative pentatricopeptide repeat-containing protein At1g12700, mitochondrial n=1 Tax=Salvia miltiorrhiza TaxID=226208 RepID=UPI0025ACF493|nr:putative pentatricopeptide repeat-containing protein At1g12700, mitochondrial [Salvia miltiorrhiza]